MMASVLHKIRSFTETVAIIANVSGAFVLLALVVIMNMDVIARGVFHAPFRGVVELVIFALVLIVFLQLPDVVRTGRLTRSDGFPSLMRAKTPRLGEGLERIIHAVSCGFMFMIVWTVWPEFTEAFESCHFFTPPEFGAQPTGAFWPDFKAALARCDYFGTPGIMTVPWWPARLAIVFGCVMAGLLFFFKTALGDPQPISDEHSEV
ncbi:TRAP transporter small permease subunit [uncultured Tateyamaria sp.]|uniref:TRAP transporter small permease subunit n=1 Tax=uncultured Tateyamaria sp. TaxID=455651 RepID=UPI002636F25D|nr:TRAP transporter small permease [uncultured Tateyamaria sp.]